VAGFEQLSPDSSKLALSASRPDIRQLAGRRVPARVADYVVRTSHRSPAEQQKNDLASGCST
jgi:hypothetical protein